MITVEFLPSDAKVRYLTFETEADFTYWLVEEYVCGHCLNELKEEYGPGPYSLYQYFGTGCGCEIDVVGLNG